ncbi:MAG: 30S ribosomal protein S10 [Sphingobacteriaceae bacterium]|nr:MAG: 30S ribosomal protein S10 [Sphingobacteriaceae bacterium]
MSVQKQKMEIIFTAYDHKILDQAVHKIIEIANRTGADTNGPIPLPRSIERFTVNRSPHIDKKSREQFEIRTHTRVLIILPTQQTLDNLMKTDLPAGVEVKIKLVGEKND